MSLSVGDVFWLNNPEVSSSKSHLHIVVGITQDKRVYYVYATTGKRFMELLCKKAEGKKDTTNLYTLVVTDSTECAELREESYINVNLSFSKSEYVLTRLRTYSPCENVKADPALLRKIDVALLSSPTKSIELDTIVRERLNL